MCTFKMFTSDDQIAAITAGLTDRTLPKECWTHAAHFAVTLWFLSRLPEAETVALMRRLIPAYNEACGGANTDTSGYHETITQASIRAAAAFLRNRSDAALFEVCNALLQSPLGKSGWILTYWSKEKLFSVEARRRWVEPDIQPLPF